MAVRRRPAREGPGQHFLRSKQLAADLVAGARLGPGDLVVEIGGGTGVLTQAIGRTGARVIVVESDQALTARLRSRFGHLDAVEIVQGDAAGHDWPSESFVVVANLPFARSGAILARLLRDPRLPLQRAHVIVQWEFATKHAAVWPATLRSIYWRAWHDISIGRHLDRQAFAPPPGVDAAVLRLERRTEPHVPLELHEVYWRFLAGAFASPRPIRLALRPTLTGLQLKRLAPALGFGLNARARELDAEQWARLFAFACERGLL
ncbi:MAG: rRNA adenine N(6)-methyltransferase family protein [Actinomycetota bacterium]|nr:rRNA adenine N(6)-methyltransferase family protein [Actinomycetota bacterium]